MKRLVSLTFIILVVMVHTSPAKLWAADKTQTVYKFTVVKPGAGLKIPIKVLPAFPVNVMVNIASITEDRDKIQIQKTGKITTVRPTAFKQTITIIPEKEQPISINMAIPFDFPKWIAPQKNIAINYSSESTVLGHTRDLLLKQDNQSLTTVQRYGMKPISTSLNGLELSQASADKSATKASSAYYFALPVTVKSKSGETVVLWQGESAAMTVGNKLLNIYVTVSEIAKPKGVAAALMEGAPFNLQFVIVQQNK